MSKHIDYAFKSYVLREHQDLLDKYIKSNKLDYLRSLLVSEGVYSKSLDFLVSKGALSKYDLIDYAKEHNVLKELKECMKIDKARNHRVYRLKQRVGKILQSGSSLFLTLTFTDDVLNKTSASTRRQYVRRFLSKYHCLYVGNIDYGKTNHREHYHALIAIDKVSHTDWTYGDIDFKRVHLQERTDTRLSKYIAKLTNHAIKETTKRSALIYSRV